VTAKEEILASFRSALETPGAERSGNIIAEELKWRAARYLADDRAILVEAISDWLNSGDELLVTQAAVLIQEFQLRELQADIERVRTDVVAGRLMKPSSAWIFDRALDRLR